MNDTSYLRSRQLELDTEIALLRAQLGVLQSERDLIQLRLDAVVYPVLTIPPEVTSEIFLHCLPSRPEPDPSFAPMLLTHICHEWSVIASSTPGLWTSLDLVACKGDSPFALADVADKWFSRSASCPLTLRVHDHYGPSSSVQAFFPFFARYSNRLKELDLCCPQSTLARTGELDFPILEKLSLKPYVDTSIAAEVVSFSRIPQLRSVKIDKIYYSHLDVDLPWEQQTDVCVGSLPLHECALLLRRATNLVRFRCSDILTAGSVPSRLPPNQQLRSLVLEHGTESFLPLLTLPALQHLGICPEVYDEDFPVATVLSFLSRSSCSLQRLCLADVFPNLVKILRAIPSTPTLCIHTWGEEEGDTFSPCAGLTGFLHKLGSGSLVLPRLKHLELHCYSTDQAFVDEYAELLAEKLWSLSGCIPFSTQVTFVVSPRNIDRLRAFTGEGVKMTVNIASPTELWSHCRCDRTSL